MALHTKTSVLHWPPRLNPKNRTSLVIVYRRLKNSIKIDVDKRGTFLEVDLEYPKEVHELLEDFPLAPERYEVTYNELSPINQFLYQKMKENNSSCTYSEEKLIETFH